VLRRLPIAANVVSETASKILNIELNRYTKYNKNKNHDPFAYLALALALVALQGKCSPEMSQRRLSTEAIDGRWTLASDCASY
jgi:hypothetical protein